LRETFPSSQRRGSCAEQSEAQTGWREARARQGEASIEDRQQRFAELTTPALRATPALRGGEYSVAALPR